MDSDEKRSRVLMTWHNLRQQNEKPAGNPNFCSPISSRPKAPACKGLHRRVRGYAGSASRSSQEIQEDARRQPDDHAESDRRPARRSVHRASARAGAPRVLGLRDGRGARQRGADRGKVSRHPAGAGIRRVPTTPRKAGCSTCSGARAVSSRDREVRDVSGLLGQRLLLRRIRNRGTLRSGSSTAIRSTITRAARTCRSRNLSAGSRRTSAIRPAVAQPRSRRLKGRLRGSTGGGRRERLVSHSIGGTVAEPGLHWVVHDGLSGELRRARAPCAAGILRDAHAQVAQAPPRCSDRAARYEADVKYPGAPRLARCARRPYGAQASAGVCARSGSSRMGDCARGRRSPEARCSGRPSSCRRRITTA